MEKNIPLSFAGSMLGVEKVSRQITKGRLRIFYEGENRNGSYMSPEFCQKLLSTLPYTPVVGIFDEEQGDFLGHSPNPNVARIYGIVPQNPNLKTETHFDEDGVQRNYFVCDVYLYTGRLEAANKIVGKAHSLELDPNSVRGAWENINGKTLFKFTDGEFLGLSVLGDSKTPCFEGSAFYELVTQFDLFMQNKVNGGAQMEEKVIDTNQELEIESFDPNENKKKNPDNEIEQQTEQETTATEESQDETEVANSDTVSENTVVEEVAADIQNPQSDVGIEEETLSNESESAVEETPVIEQETSTDLENEALKTEANTDSKASENVQVEEVIETESQETTPEETLSDNATTEEVAYTISVTKEQLNAYEEIVGEDGFDSLLMKYSAIKNEISEKDAKIVEFEKEISTLKAEAEQQIALFTELKDKYDILASEKAEELKVQKNELVSEYSKYIEPEVLETIDIEKFSLTELEKELLFASKPKLLNTYEKTAPISLEGRISASGDRVIGLLQKQKEKEK